MILSYVIGQCKEEHQQVNISKKIKLLKQLSPDLNPIDMLVLGFKQAFLALIPRMWLNKNHSAKKIWPKPLHNNVKRSLSLHKRLIPPKLAIQVI